MRWYAKILSGLRTGSLLYLSLIYFNGATTVTYKTITIVFLISMFVGYMSNIFEIERFSFLLSLLLHYMATTLFVSLLYIVNFNGIDLTNLIFSIAFVYFIAYFFVMFQNKLIVKELNSRLEKIKSER